MVRASEIKEIERERPRFIKRFSVSLTQEQYDRLSAVAEASGLRLSELVRRRVNGVAIPRAHIGVMQAIKNLTGELARQGGLIKHLYELNPRYSKETAAALGAWRSFFCKAVQDWDEIRDQIEDEVTPL